MSALSDLKTNLDIVGSDIAAVQRNIANIADRVGSIQATIDDKLPAEAQAFGAGYVIYLSASLDDVVAQIADIKVGLDALTGALPVDTLANTVSLKTAGNLSAKPVG